MPGLEIFGILMLAGIAWLWLDSLKYGARTADEKVVIRSAVDSFWLNNSLKVTPDQQVGLGLHADGFHVDVERRWCRADRDDEDRSHDQEDQPWLCSQSPRATRG